MCAIFGYEIVYYYISYLLHHCCCPYEQKGTDDHLRKNTFLTGNFAPVSKEHVSLPVEVVEGSIPLNLNGAFCRNGPNPIRNVQKKRYHWFDGRELSFVLLRWLLSCCCVYWWKIFANCCFFFFAAMLDAMLVSPVCIISLTSHFVPLFILTSFISHKFHLHTLAHSNVQKWRGLLHQSICTVATLFYRTRTWRRVFPYHRRV